MNDKNEINYCPYCGHDLSGFQVNDSNEDDLYNDAVRVVSDCGKASASLLQRRLRIGYAKAARLIAAMEEKGVIGPADGARPRKIVTNSLDENSQPDEKR